MTSAAVKVRGARVVALRATGLQVDGDVLCEVDDGQPFTAMGEVRLRRAHVRGQLSLSGARLIVPDQNALSAEGLQVDHTMFCSAGAGSDSRRSVRSASSMRAFVKRSV